MPTRPVLGPRISAALAMLLLVSVVPRTGVAQGEGFLEGVVVDGRSLLPVEGARITVSGQGADRITDADGAFSFGVVPIGVVQFRVEHDGYSSSVEQVEVVPDAGTFLQLSLAPITAILDQLLVRSGRRQADLDAVDQSDSDSGDSAADLLTQRLPGVRVDRGTGALGGGVEVRVRGVGSISGAREPAIFLDGVRLNPSRAPGLSLRTTPGLQILDEIPASTVQSIRVLRGPSASVAYGESADGVIIIETVRGAGPDAGAPSREPRSDGFPR